MCALLRILPKPSSGVLPTNVEASARAPLPASPAEGLCLCRPPSPPQTLQVGIYHFSGLFVLFCLGLGSALLSSLGEHVFYHLVLPRMRRGNRLQYWLHTSQVRGGDTINIAII